MQTDTHKFTNKLLVKPGWGDWAGPGATGVSRKTLLRRDLLLKEAEKEAEERRKKRKDSKMYRVMISDRRIKAASKYKLEGIPHPFTSREEYERSIQMPLGGIFCLPFIRSG